MKLPPSILKAAALRPANAVMFCPQCGTANTRDSKFCKECGESLVTTYAPKSSPDPFVQAGLGKEDQLQRLLDMAFWHNEAGNIGAALLACQAALALNDRCSTAWSLMGCLYEKKGDLDKAVEAFEVVCALNPDSVAEAQKLEALRRGIHVKAVPQPPAYRWIPPAFAKIVQEKPSAPAVGAAGAALVVLALGVMAIRPLFSAPQGPGGHYADLAVSHSAWSSGQSGAIGQDIATMPGRPQAINAGAFAAPSARMATAPAIVPSNRDPFVGTAPAAAAPIQVADEPKASDASDKSQDSAHSSLPPLSVKGLPDSGDVRPLSTAVVASTADVPEHTVMVTGAGADTSAPNDTTQNPPSAQQQVPGDGGSPPPTPQISITVHGLPANSGQVSQDGDGGSVVPPDTGPARHLVLSADSGSALQQKALTYMEQGDYARAQAAYQKAIAAYQSEENSGTDSDAAVRGIQACETGLQICRQSR